MTNSFLAAFHGLALPTAQIARRAGVGRSHLYDVLRGDVEPSAAMVARFKAAFPAEFADVEEPSGYARVLLCVKRGSPEHAEALDLFRRVRGC